MIAICHIVPRLPPLVDGVGDYALHLARTLRAEHGVAGEFAVADPRWQGESTIQGFRVHKLEACDVTLLQTGATHLLLHYVGYGYDRRGLPVELVDSLERASRPLVTMFHELWSSGPPWRRDFFRKPSQRRLIERLKRISAVHVTSTVRMAGLLGGSEVVPIPSNFEPMQRTRPPGAAAIRALIFGQAGARQMALREHVRLLRELHRRGVLERLVIAGADASISSEGGLARGLPVEIHGTLAPHDVAWHFSDADCFLSACPASLVCKSGTFMAALASGCPAVLVEGRNAAPLAPEKHFLVCDGSPSAVDALLHQLATGAGGEGQEWYRQHADWPVAAAKFNRLITPLT